MQSSNRRARALSSRHTLALAACGAALACSTNNTYLDSQYIYESRGDAGAPRDNDDDDNDDDPTPPVVRPDAGSPTPDAGAPPADGLPVVDSTPEALSFDVFESVGASYYFVVSDQQLEKMNQRYGGGIIDGPGFPGGGVAYPDDFYSPGGGNGGADVTFVDHLFVTTNGDTPHTADFGKVQVKLVGESTGRPWTLQSLPNLKIDSDEFQQGKRISGVKHMRFNNAVVGSIFREKLTLDLYERLGYPAPRATYAWVQSSVWGPDVKVPYILVESYKPQFCKAREAELGGDCVNMWEFPGDFGYGAFAYEESCQFDACDPARVTDFELDVMQTREGPGYKEALAEWLDWDAFHKFQCLSWILATGDDALHNSNNLVLMERADGKFQYLPYSVDISLGQSWYSEVSLGGSNSTARGCQSDPQCWADTVSTCETVLDAFAAADPIGMLNEIYSDLEEREMLRDGDEDRYQALARYLEKRLAELPAELELQRDGPVEVCRAPFVPCGDYCAYPGECFICEPDQPDEPLPEGPIGADAGAGEPSAEEPVGEEAPADDDQGGAGGAPGFNGAAGGAIADDEARIVIGEPGDIAIPEFPIPNPGGGGGVCLPPIEIYDPPVMQPRPF